MNYYFDDRVHNNLYGKMFQIYLAYKIPYDPIYSLHENPISI